MSWKLKIASSRAEAFLADLRMDHPKLILQVFSADSPPNGTAIEMIAAQTLMAARSGSTLAVKPELDLLLRLAGTRQIGEAFSRLGYKSGGENLFLVAASPSKPPLERLARRLASEEVVVEKLARKELGENDLQMVERAALLSAGL